jgi:hypothetical protein
MMVRPAAHDHRFRILRPAFLFQRKRKKVIGPDG